MEKLTDRSPRTQPYYAKIAMASGCNNDAALGAAAEPPEARAAARWIKEQQFQWVENCAIAQDKDSGDAWDEDYVYLPELLTRYADDLQRQLDEARREREALLSELTSELGLTKSYADRFEVQKKMSKKLLGRFTEEKQRAESAEAANQELRHALQEIADDWEHDNPQIDTGTNLCPHCKALAALLGPQHGDTK